MTTIQFYIPDDADNMQGNVLADFVISVTVPEWGGTIDSRGRIIRSNRGGNAVIWPRHNGSGRYHATPQPHEQITVANEWIMARYNEWRNRR